MTAEALWKRALANRQAAVERADELRRAKYKTLVDALPKCTVCRKPARFLLANETRCGWHRGDSGEVVASAVTRIVQRKKYVGEIEMNVRKIGRPRSVNP